VAAHGPSERPLVLGRYATALGSYGLLQTLTDKHKSAWILLAAIAFLLAYGAALAGLSIFVLGMLLRRYGEALGRALRPQAAVEHRP
jgi:hypothetical protein